MRKLTDSYPAIKYDWVVGRFKGDRAKSVINHTGAGMAYFVLDTIGVGQSQTVIAAFRKACDSPIPEHLELVTDIRKIEKLEKMRKERQGLQNATS